MDGFSSFSESQSSSRNRWSYLSLKNFRQWDPVVQNHLKKVFLVLCCALIASPAGACLHILWNIGGLLSTLGGMGSIIWLLSTPPNEERKRVTLLMAAALLEGASAGPLIVLAMKIDRRILASAIVGCTLAFGCFSMATELARHREYLYLGGVLSSGFSILFGLYFAFSFFGVSASLFKLQFVCYMVVDTRYMIEKAQFGDLDYVKHALTLFAYYPVIFVRIMIIMLKNIDEQNKEKKKKRN